MTTRYSSYTGHPWQENSPQHNPFAHKDGPTTSTVNPFDDSSIRLLFVRKVFSLLACMVLATTAVVSLFVYSESVKLFVANNGWITTTCMVVYFGSALAISLSTDMRRKHPTNIILLTIFTLATSFMLGVICSIYTAQSVALAGGITAITCTLVAVLATTTKIDFTRWYGVFLSILWGISLWKLLFALPLRIPEVDRAYASLGAGLFILILIVDIQMIVGGKRMVVNPEEYVFAAMQVYLDIVNIFLEILKIVGKREESGKSKNR